MRILLVGLNARYVHTNLAIRYLGQALKNTGGTQYSVIIREYSINDSLQKIAAGIFEEKPDILAFSCYIWNITQVLALIRHLRQVLPHTRFCVGGPEVSYDPLELLTNNPEIDAVVVGEGEESFPALVRAWTAGKMPWEVEGIVWYLREQSSIFGRLVEEFTPPGFMGTIYPIERSYIIMNAISEKMICLDQIPDPYTQEEDFQGKLVYVETGRGCPFNCRFCISSTFRGVRLMEPEKFRSMVRRLFSRGARTIKFVDRTFNFNKKHAFAILNIFKEEALALMQESKSSTVVQRVPRAHCEMAGELLDQDWLDYLYDYPKEMIQLEIGVQSTHQPTLDAVNRPQHFERWKEKVRFIQHTCNVPVHLDLIAGLPLEGWREFKMSFDDVYNIKPNHLQLGFLKVLKGSGIWEKRTEYGLIYTPDPPYTILQTNHLTHTEILALGRLEEIIETYLNSGRFKFILQVLLYYQESPFEFFYEMAEFGKRKGWFNRSLNLNAVYQNLWDFITEQYPPTLNTIEIMRDALRFDYFLTNRPGEIPEFLREQTSEAEALYTSKDINKIREKIRSDISFQQKIPEMSHMDKRQWSRASAIEHFVWDIPEAANGNYNGGGWYLFVYSHGETQFYKLDAEYVDVVSVE